MCTKNKEHIEQEDLNNKSWEDRIDTIKNNLYIGGGKGQASALLSIMMSPYSGKDFGYSDIDVSDLLSTIACQIKELRSTIRNGAIFPISIIDSSFKNFMQKHMPYACLDNDLKFCVKHYGEEDWKDILYVFPYMNCTTAYDVSFKYDHIHHQDMSI